jgi:hypothetical protein
MQSLLNRSWHLRRPSDAGGRGRKADHPRLTRLAFGLVVFGFGLLVIFQHATAASFSNATPLSTPRGGHTATLLSNGKVLVAGGATDGGFTSAAAEVYDPASGAWTVTGPMIAERTHQTATMLPNGRILVAGGYSSTNGALSSAELYEPFSGIWTITGPMKAARFLHTATLLPGGQVLVAGGTADGSTAISNAEIYDPATGTWTATNELNFARYSHTASLLPDGQVLIAGGIGGEGALVPAAELFAPSSGTWTVTNSLTTARFSHSATLLPSGLVMVAGGTTNGSTSIRGAELYDPSSGTWTPTNSLATTRFAHTATLLPNGFVLVTGGTSDGNGAVTNAETFNPGNGTWAVAGLLNSARYTHTATLLAGGEVLVCGGVNGIQALSSVERYNPAGGAWGTTGPMTVTESYLTQTLLANGKVLVLGGGFNRGEVYDPSSGTWAATSPMLAAHFSPSVTLLANGRVLVAGGSISGNFITTAELYDSAPGTWTGTGSMQQSRGYQTATLLPGGKVLVAGGVTGAHVSLASAELYEPATGKWTATGSMNAPRAAAMGILLPNGKVLVAGGFARSTNVTSAEIYDPGSGTWTPTGSMTVGREDATVTLLPNGKVLVVAGYGDSGALAGVELYDPAAGTWTLAASLPAPRYYHSATLLFNGKTLVAGGSDGRINASSAFLYDAATGVWQATGALIVGRAAHAASLLPNGKVLVAGGTSTVDLSSAELYEPGLGFSNAWQPRISAVSVPSSNSTITITGSGFRGVSEGSSGNSQDSAADYPVIELMSLESGQPLFPGVTNWSASAIAAPPVAGLPPGYLLATVFANGIPSAGQIFKLPSLPIISNLPATGIGVGEATLNGQILDTGGNTPAVSVYYGTSDGATNEAAWSNGVALGFQTGVFAQTISGLASNTTYYFTSKAVNIIGATWATPSRSFTTITLPIITNLPATGVQDTFATLNGQVLFNGNQTPSVRVFYGPSDGGTNAAAWSNSVALGPQNGAFAQTVNFLLRNTPYFFTAQATNAAGGVWAIPSQPFTTAATNSLVGASTAVVTHHNDNGRTGMNLNETLLNVSNVNTNTFGLLYTRPVDDQLYTQPLVMTNVNLPGKGTHNIVIVATVNDTIYAYDADQPSQTAAYWTTSFINPPNIVPPNNADESAIGACGGNYKDFSGNFGIVGTPVIEAGSGTIYLVARTKEFGTNFVQKLHALDITTGLERSNSPVVITASYPGSGAGSVGGVIRFDPLRSNQRPALALVNGVVYISWASHCDNGPYHGWVIGYDARTLQQAALFNDTPNGSNGGIWMSGQGPSADSNGNIYLTAGNGTVDATDYGESFLKLSPPVTGTVMTVASYFIPFNWPTLNSLDLDLGSAGILLVPGTSLAISGGKSGTLYVVDRDNMGGISSGDVNIVQSWTPNASSEIHGGPVWWSGPSGSYMYIWPDSGEHLRQYVSVGSAFNTTPYSQSATACGPGSHGGILSISANGNSAGSGIIWANINTRSDANQSVTAGTLHAYNAQAVSSELWHSDMLPRDSVGNLAKFVPPTIANGRVYMATFSGRLSVYGLLPVGANLTAQTFENQPISIPVGKLLALATEPYGFPLAVSGVSSTSTNGGSVMLAPNAVTYTPPIGYVGSDRFSYTIGNGQGGVASANIFIQVIATNQPSANMSPPSTGSGGVMVSFAGIPGLTYTVQRASTPVGPWTTLATVTVGESGIGLYLDPNPAGEAYYRTTYP